jgi:DNA modification methylase
MNPYYQDEKIVIYHGDCLEILPHLTYDVVITDPPYGINLNTDNSRFSGGSQSSKSKRSTGKGTGGGKKIIGDNLKFDPNHLLSVPGVIWGWNNFADKLPSGSCLVWIKRNDAAFGSFLSDAEVAWMSKVHGVYCKKDLTNQSIAKERKHPTQKPVGIMEWSIGFFPTGIIVDPYMGSGTTLVAAQNLGRRAIGIEIEEKYCEIAVKRLSQQVLLV